MMYDKFIRIGGALIVVFWVGAWLGLYYGAQKGLAQVANIKVQYATATATAIAQQAYQDQQAQRTGRDLAATLSQKEALLTIQQKRTQHALNHTTHNTPCLNTDAVRLLNARAGVDPDTLPGAASSTDAADADALAGDIGGATDSAVAQWAAAVQAQYGQCAAKLDALITFEERGK